MMTTITMDNDNTDAAHSGIGLSETTNSIAIPDAVWEPWLSQLIRDGPHDRFNERMQLLVAKDVLEQDVQLSDRQERIARKLVEVHDGV